MHGLDFRLFRRASGLAKPHLALAAVFVMLGGSVSSYGQSDTPAAEPKPGSAVDPAVPVKEPAKTTASKLAGQPVQESDDEAAPLDSSEPRSAADLQKLDAKTWYATGRVLEGRNDSKGALNAYRRALKLDPAMTAAMDAIIPLAFNENFTDEAEYWGDKLAGSGGGGFERFRRLAEYRLRQGDLKGAVRWLERAVAADGLERQSSLYVVAMYQLAQMYQELKDFAKAADSYAIVFEALDDPQKYKLDFNRRAQILANPAETYERMAEVFLEARRTELAIAAFRKTAESRKSNPGLLGFNLARVYARSGSPDKALPELQKYFDAELQSKGTQPYALLVDVMNKTGKGAETLSRLQKLAESDPNNVLLSVFYADQLALAEKFEEAEKRYKDALARGDEPLAQIGLVNLYRRQKRAGDLIDALGEIIKTGEEPTALQPDVKAISSDESFTKEVVAQGLKQLDEKTLSAGSALVLGRIAAEGIDPDASSRFFRHILSSGRSLRNLAYRELSDMLFDCRRYAEAAEVLDEALNDGGLADPRVHNFRLRRAQALGLSGQKEAALQILRDLRNDLGVQLPGVRALLDLQEAWVFYNAKEYAEARDRFERVARLPQKPDEDISDYIQRAKFSLSAVLVAMGEFDAGEKVLEDLYNRNPDDPQANNDLGYLWVDHNKNLERSEAMIRKALAAEPDNGSYLDSMGWALHKLGRSAEALPFLDRAMRIPSSHFDETLWDHRGDVLEKLGRIDEALASFRRALELARKGARADDKLIERIEQKIKNLEMQAANKPAP